MFMSQMKALITEVFNNTIDLTTPSDAHIPTYPTPKEIMKRKPTYTIWYEVGIPRREIVVVVNHLLVNSRVGSDGDRVPDLYQDRLLGREQG